MNADPGSEPPPAGGGPAAGGRGHFLQPLFAPDLARPILGCGGRSSCFGRLFCVAGPEIVLSRTYYRIIADLLGVDLHVHELPVDETRAAHPETAPFLCHRICDLEPLAAAGLEVPRTPLKQGLAAHVRALMESASPD